MKELIKPNAEECLTYEVSSYCEIDCTGGRGETANRGCAGRGSTNNSISDESEIIF